MAVYRVKLRWTGFTGAPGYTNLHFDVAAGDTVAGAQSVYDQVQTFAIDIAARLPSAVTLTTEAGVEVIDQATNELITIHTVTAGTNTKGQMTGGFSSATGACIVWETGEVKNGRRVRGRTFIVPLSAVAYEADGTLTASAITGLQDAASKLTAGGFGFGVLSRPSSSGASDGSFHTASSGRVNDKTAILRSRRD